MHFETLSSAKDLVTAFTIINELRPHLDRDLFLSLYESAKKADDYTLVGSFQGNECVAVMGYRFLYDFVHGKHLYIDDLIVTPGLRSKGIGKELLKYAEKIAGEGGCQKLRLSTGIENVKAKSFYEREGWALRSVTYKKDS